MKLGISHTAQVSRESYVLDVVCESSRRHAHSSTQTPLSQVTVEDWDKDGEMVTLKFDTKAHHSPREEADVAFAKARRLRRGSAVLYASILI